MVREELTANAGYTTLNDMYELWKDLKRGLKNNTFENYKYMYETFVRQQIGSKTVSSLKKTDIKRFYNYLADERHLKPATIDNIAPSEYRKHPVPVVLRTLIKPFDCYLMGIGGTGMAKSSEDVKTYFVTIPAHKFLHIRNYESIGYWDFWQKQSLIPGQDCETICGLLDSISGKLDDAGGEEADSGSGQLMAFINEPTGRICSWGIPLAEAYGVRLPVDYDGEIPAQMQMMDVPDGEYIVFEHGPFDFETENSSVEQKIENAMSAFDYAEAGYCLDTTPGRVFYFYHDCKRFWKYVRPVKKIK